MPTSRLGLHQCILPASVSIPPDRPQEQVAPELPPTTPNTKKDVPISHRDRHSISDFRSSLLSSSTIHISSFRSLRPSTSSGKIELQNENEVTHTRHLAVLPNKKLSTFRARARSTRSCTSAEAPKQRQISPPTPTTVNHCTHVPVCLHSHAKLHHTHPTIKLQEYRQHCATLSF